MSKKKRMEIEQKERRVPDIRTMVMYHKRPDGTVEQRCPYCKRRNLKIIDYDVSEEHEQRFGPFKFIKKCMNPECRGLCKHIGNI